MNAPQEHRNATTLPAEHGTTVPPVSAPPVDWGAPPVDWNGGWEPARSSFPFGSSQVGDVPGTHAAADPYAQPQYQHQFPVQYVPAYLAPQILVRQPRSNGLGVAGFVTGLLGLVFFWVPGLGLTLGALGVILGGVGMSAARKVGSSNGLAVAGLILGIVSVIPAILVLTALSSTNF